jgi:hypothetical protein
VSIFVTCCFTVQEELQQFLVDGQDLTAEVEPQVALGSRFVTKTVTFHEPLNPSIIAFKGFDNNEILLGSMMLRCNSTNPLSHWNMDTQSKFGERSEWWKSVLAINLTANDFGGCWYCDGFVGQERNALVSPEKYTINSDCGVPVVANKLKSRQGDTVSNFWTLKRFVNQTNECAETHSPTSWIPTSGPTVKPTVKPLLSPSILPTVSSTYTPSQNPINLVSSTSAPTQYQSQYPSKEPAVSPTYAPSQYPSNLVSSTFPSTQYPSQYPTDHAPTISAPSHFPSNPMYYTSAPSNYPSRSSPIATDFPVPSATDAPVSTNFGCSDTAWAFSISTSTCFRDVAGLGKNRWGWTNGAFSASESMTFEIWAGAAKCQLSKGQYVGSGSLSISGSEATITYATYQANFVGVIKAYIGNVPFYGDYEISPGELPVTVDASGAAIALGGSFDPNSPIYFYVHFDTKHGRC